MVEGNASMYLGSPRMAEMVIGEKVTLEEMGGARMHCTVSGCGDVLVKTEEEAIAYARRYLSYFPSNYSEKPPVVEAKPPKSFDKTIEDIVPDNQNAPFNMYDLIERIIDEGSFCEIKNCLRRKSLPDWRALPASRSASSPTSRASKAACCSTIRLIKRRNSSRFATRSISRFCFWPTSLAL